MSRRRGNRDPRMRAFQAEVMRREGFSVDPKHPENVKYEVAKELGVPLEEGYNGKLSTESAGRVGGRIGGSMVKELIRMAQEDLAKKNP